MTAPTWELLFGSPDLYNTAVVSRTMLLYIYSFYRSEVRRDYRFSCKNSVYAVIPILYRKAINCGEKTEDKWGTGRLGDTPPPPAGVLPCTPGKAINCGGEEEWRTPNTLGRGVPLRPLLWREDEWGTPMPQRVPASRGVPLHPRKGYKLWWGRTCQGRLSQATPSWSASRRCGSRWGPPAARKNC